MKENIKKWIERDGQNFLTGLGIKKGQTVLDFGCGKGHYTIPAVKIVGNKGEVYAIDKDKKALKELLSLAESEELKNIKTIIPKKELQIFEISDCFIDVVLLYDIIHLVSDRGELYEEVYRILKLNGLLSIYPKHYMNNGIADDAGWRLKNISLKDIIKEVEKVNFRLEKKLFEKLLHEDYFDEGYILNFRKS